jgi:hypothetical protein
MLDSTTPRHHDRDLARMIRSGAAWALGGAGVVAATWAFGDGLTWVYAVGGLASVLGVADMARGLAGATDAQRSTPDATRC